jgi:hypothetical protein
MAGVLIRRSTSTTTRVTQPGIQESAQLSTFCTTQLGEGSRTQIPPEPASRIIIIEKLVAAYYYITELEAEI